MLYFAKINLNRHICIKINPTSKISKNNYELTSLIGSSNINR